MSPDQAIVAATAAGPMTIGPLATGSGTLEEGMPADVIALSANPLQRIEILANEHNVTHVWKGGTLVKDSGE
jgi:imidazolonepropionase-like amidohydrolase